MIWDDFKKVNDLFEDNLSKQIFENKVKWYYMGGEDATISYLYDHYSTSKIVGFENYNNVIFAICGAGEKGRKH